MSHKHTQSTTLRHNIIKRLYPTLMHTLISTLIRHTLHFTNRAHINTRLLRLFINPTIALIHKLINMSRIIRLLTRATNSQTPRNIYHPRQIINLRVIIRRSRQIMNRLSITIDNFLLSRQTRLILRINAHQALRILMSLRNQYVHYHVSLRPMAILQNSTNQGNQINTKHKNIIITQLNSASARGRPSSHRSHRSASGPSNTLPTTFDHLHDHPNLHDLLPNTLHQFFLLHRVHLEPTFPPLRDEHQRQPTNSPAHSPTAARDTTKPPTVPAYPRGKDPKQYPIRVSHQFLQH